MLQRQKVRSVLHTHLPQCRSRLDRANHLCAMCFANVTFTQFIRLRRELLPHVSNGTLNCILSLAKLTNWSRGRFVASTTPTASKHGSSWCVYCNTRSLWQSAPESAPDNSGAVTKFHIVRNDWTIHKNFQTGGAWPSSNTFTGCGIKQALKKISHERYNLNWHNCTEFTRKDELPPNSSDLNLLH